jgi:hypothetical protein
MEIRRTIGCALLSLSLLAGTSGAFFSVIAIQRFMLDYNEEGRYFDPQTSVVYDEDARLAYTFIAATNWVAVAVFLGLWYWTRKPRR